MPSNLDEIPSNRDNKDGRHFKINKKDLGPGRRPCETGNHNWQPDPAEETDVYYGEYCNKCHFGRLKLKKLK